MLTVRHSEPSLPALRQATGATEAAERVSVDELLQTWLVGTVKRARRKLRRPATA